MYVRKLNDGLEEEIKLNPPQLPDLTYYIFCGIIWKTKFMKQNLGISKICAIKWVLFLVRPVETQSSMYSLD